MECHQTENPTALYQMSVDGGVQAQTDQFMSVVLEAVYASTPKPKPSPLRQKMVNKKPDTAQTSLHIPVELGEEPAPGWLGL